MVWRPGLSLKVEISSMIATGFCPNDSPEFDYSTFE
jgi:hypothetical protein